MIITDQMGARVWWDGDAKEWKPLKEMPQPMAYQYIALKGALRLEMAGMKRRGRSAYAILKSHGYQGSREAVMERLKEDVKALTGGAA